MASVTKRVTKIIVDKLVIDEAEVVRTASFKKDLGADSIDIVELIMEFEREFNVNITDEAAEGLRTVADAISYLERNMEP